MLGRVLTEPRSVVLEDHTPMITPTCPRVPRNALPVTLEAEHPRLPQENSDQFVRLPPELAASPKPGSELGTQRSSGCPRHSTRSTKGNSGGCLVADGRSSSRAVEVRWRQYKVTLTSCASDCIQLGAELARTQVSAQSTSLAASRGVQRQSTPPRFDLAYLHHSYQK
jgi:hypothetical protein